MSKKVEWSSIHGKGELNRNPYRALADAIILQAVDDYRKHKELRGSIARFFKSDWFKVLTDIDGEYLLEKLKEDIILGFTRITN